ncbi:hypothetical protein Bhyg_14383, partial [Pseudolycoriella hygida]
STKTLQAKELLPNLERLSLPYFGLPLNNLQNLENLRHLTLNCFGRNANSIFTDLAERNCLEELVLHHVAVDEDTFRAIRKFEKLKMLAVTSKTKVQCPTKFASRLKVLMLGGFNFRKTRTSMKHLTELKDLHLEDCFVNDDRKLVSSFRLLVDYVLEELNCHKNRQINVAVTCYHDSPMKIAEIMNVCLFNETKQLNLTNLRNGCCTKRLDWIN